MASLTALHQTSVNAVRRKGQLIVPRRSKLPPPGFAKISVETVLSGTTRGFDTSPAFGDVDPDEVEGLAIAEATVNEAGLVVLAFTGGAQVPADPNPLDGMSIYIEGSFYDLIPMQWNAANSRYESTELRPDFYEALEPLPV